jgi:phage repressor protein C with HTH and peptisase S24 domain
MIDAHICDGDVILVRRQESAQPNDIVAAMVDGEATVKRFARDERAHRAEARASHHGADRGRRTRATSGSWGNSSGFYAASDATPLH